MSNRRPPKNFRQVMEERRKSSAHNKRLADAVSTYQHRREAGTLEGRPSYPLPTDATPTTVDLNDLDNVTPISKHPRWRWRG